VALQRIKGFQSLDTVVLFLANFVTDAHWKKTEQDRQRGIEMRARNEKAQREQDARKPPIKKREWVSIHTLFAEADEAQAREEARKEARKEEAMQREMEGKADNTTQQPDSNSLNPFISDSNSLDPFMSDSPSLDPSISAMFSWPGCEPRVPFTPPTTKRKLQDLDHEPIPEGKRRSSPSAEYPEILLQAPDGG
jgi:hypothetical protein